MTNAVKTRAAEAALSIGSRLFRPEELQSAYRKLRIPGLELPSPMAKVAFAGLKGLSRVTNVDALAMRYVGEVRGHQATPTATNVYDHHLLHLLLNRVYDLPEVSIDRSRPRTINILVPSFDFRSMSAGFFGVFQAALFMKSCGHHVRCVFFDNFYYNEAEFREKFRDYPGMEHLYDELEMDYIGERKAPLRVSPDDTCLATVWYSAHFANKIMNTIGGKPFIYLIQDYETNFFAGSTLYALADTSYTFNYHALFSTKALMDFCVGRGIDRSAANGNAREYYDNACAAHLMPRDEFLAVNGAKAKRDLVFYARPVVNRNMFELGALALIEAYRQGVLKKDEWNFHSVGLGEGRIDLEPGVSVQHLPRMTLKEYTATIGRFDLGLTLMASPHPSLLPMDLGGSGCICVTNTFETKTPEFLSTLNGNVIAAAPDLRALVKGLAEGVERARDVEARWAAAKAATYPRTWDETFTDRHRAFMKRVMERR